MILVNKNALHLVKTYWDYVGIKSMEKGFNRNIRNDLRVKSFLKCLDCPDIWQDMYVSWNNKIK